MNILDSSAWLEVLTGGGNSQRFQHVVVEEKELLVPTIVIAEVWRFLVRDADTQTAQSAIGALFRCVIVDLDSATAMAAGDFSLKYKLPLADSLIYATAQSRKALLWTQDAHFEGLPDVKFFAKAKAKVRLAKS